MAQPPPTPSLSRPQPSLWPRLALFMVALDLLGLYVYLGRRDYLLNPVWIYLTAYTLLFAGYVYAAGRLVPRFPVSCARWLLPLILVGGVLFRLAVLPAPPSLSTDMYRYVWDGRLTMHGINPYRWTPNAQTLRSLRDPIWQQMEYKPYQTIYMPVSQAFFALGNALFGNSLIGFKALYTLFDCGVIALGMLLLRRLGRPPTQIVWYAWCPLPITEVALAGHQDVVGVFFLLTTFVLVMRPKTIAWAAVTLVAAALTKGFALLLLPLFCRSFGWRFTIIAAGCLLYLGMPMWVYLPEFLHGMTQYLDNVHANAGLFHGVDMLLQSVTRSHYAITQKLADVVILSVVVWAGWRPVTSFHELLRRSFIVLAVTLLVVPTLFPWYLLWTLPLTTLIGRRPSWAFILLTGLVVLLYTYYISILTYWWTPLAEYVPFYLALALECRFRRGLWSVTPARLNRLLPLAQWPPSARRTDKTPTSPQGRTPV